ncbi:c-type cytochrome [Paenibacillus taichungensis]|uniref:c-type cytochrome n=1 Tax=Paenibacillus taichungensis TaxID=484184 RepID=UPI002871A891|nr:cytochrome c [Paenibacillus taichungensis]MDR9748584.1 cytochrome c [Paenibacillus taichungensis]
MRKRLSLFTVSIVTVLALAACEGNSSQQKQAGPDAATTDSDSSTTGTYKQYCLSCHAADLSGKVGPSLKTIGSRLSKEEIMEKITTGTGGMPSFRNRLSEQDIDALGSWLANKK